MAQQKLDLTANEAQHRTFEKIDQMLVDLYATAGLTTKQKLDLTFNEPAHRMLGKIDQMLTELYAALLPGSTRSKLDRTQNEPWHRVVARMNFELTALYGGSATPSRTTLPGGDVVALFLAMDSQGAGTGNPTNFAAYKALYAPALAAAGADPTQVVTLNRSSAWVTYDPTVYAGEDFSSGTKVGQEMTFAMDFVAKYTNKLRIIKITKPGSFLGEGVPLAATGTTNVTTNGTASVVTNSGAALVAGSRIKGGTLPLNAYIWTIGTPNMGARFGVYTGANPANPAFPAQTVDVTQYDGLGSWDLNSGGLWVGVASSSFRVRTKVINALTALGVAGTDYTIRSWVSWLGTNDASDASNTAGFGASWTALEADIRTALSIPTLKVTRILLNNATGGNFTTIRNNIIADAAARPTLATAVEVTDLQPTWDGTHFDYPGLATIGHRAFTAAGL